MTADLVVNPTNFSSAIYSGIVAHRRFTPHSHEFNYRMFMLYLDLDELPRLFDRRWLWSSERWNVASFRRRDFLVDAEDPTLPLRDAVRATVARVIGFQPRGPVRLLTHLAYFGYSFNPVSFYYCFDASGTEVEAVVAEITNTPWDERHSYILADANAEMDGKWRGEGARRQGLFRFNKIFHVSPFFPMEMRYLWTFGTPGDRLSVYMRSDAGDESESRGRKAFEASLELSRKPWTGWNLAAALSAYPFMTAKVSGAIYWQAFRLFLKRTPFYSHPDKRSAP